MASRVSHTRPNILFILTDQQRWDTLGCYGQPLDVTPNLDRMASEGVRFEHAFTCQPLCGPARAAIQTGKFPTQTGNFRNGIPLPLQEKTIAHLLSQAGYSVAYIGKWHLGGTQALPVPFDLRGGYRDYWLAADALEHTSHAYEGYVYDARMKRVDFQGYRVDCITDFALEYLRTIDSRKPFFLFLSYLEPHHQNDENRFVGPLGSESRFKDFVVPGDLIGRHGDWEQQYPDYLGCCASLDENVGRIRTELSRLGIAANTLIIYTSDHGCHFRTRNDEYKRSCHESSIRIPLIVCGPGFSGGRVVSEIVSLIDLAPTVLTAAGVAKPRHMMGRPIQQLLTEGSRAWPEEAFIQISEHQIGRAIRTRRWKYSVWVPTEEAGVASRISGSDVYVEQCLYDLERDPYEQTNLISEGEYADIRLELSGVLKRWMAYAGEGAPEILPASERFTSTEE